MAVPLPSVYTAVDRRTIRGDSLASDIKVVLSWPLAYGVLPNLGWLGPLSTEYQLKSVEG